MLSACLKDDSALIKQRLFFAAKYARIFFQSTVQIVLILASSYAYGQSVETIIQKGHELSVRCVAISPDSNLVATGSNDKTIKLWNVGNAREIRNLLGHKAAVRGIAFSPDGKTLASCSNDETFRLWDILSGQAIYQSPPMGDVLTSVAFLADGEHLVVGGYPWEAYIWNIAEKRIVQRIKANPNKGTGSGISVATSKDGKWFALGQDNHITQVFDAVDFQLQYTFQHEEGYCGGCANYITFSPDSRFLYMIAEKGVLKKYDLSTGMLIKELTPETENLTALDCSPDGEKILVVTVMGSLIYNTGNGTLIRSIETTDQAQFNQGKFTQDGKQVILTQENNVAIAYGIANEDKKIYTGMLNERDKGGVLYDPNFYWESHIARYIRIKNYLKISPDGKSLIRGKFGVKLKKWNMANGQDEMEYIGHEKAPYCFDFSADGQQMASSGADGRIIIWSLQTGDTLKTWKAHREPVFDLRFSHDQKKIISSSWDASIKIFDTSSGKLLQHIDLQNNSAFVASFDQSDLYFFASRLNKNLEMWEPDTRTVVRTFVGHTDGVSSIQQSKDGQKLLSASWDGTVRLWNIATGLSLMKLEGHEAGVHTAIFSVDEQRIFSAGADRTIQVWNTASGQLEFSLKGHQSEITSLDISKDNKTLVSHSLDGTTKFWDLDNRIEFYEHIHIGERDWMAKTSDGYFNITSGAHDKIHFVSGLKTYAVEQFFETFYRPDLLPALYKNRGATKGQSNIQGKLNTSPPPEVRVAIVPSSDPGKAEVYVRATDMGGGIDEIKLLHNGKSLSLKKSIERKRYPKDEPVILKEEVALIEGENTLSATAFNLSRVESAPHSTSIIAQLPAKKSSCYLFAVGINQYKNDKLELNYARSDAESFKKVIEENTSGLFNSIELIYLYDEQASRSNILKALDDIARKVKPEDVFIFYYAGHGSVVDNQFFFIPSESLRLYDLKSLQKEAIEASLLQDKFKNIAALKQMIVMDACQSGASVELLATRGAAEEKAIAQLSRSAGIHVLASAGSEQFASEFAELGHGLFTYVLIKALQGDADGAPNDGKVTIYELKSYLEDQVPEMTRKLKGKPQYPFTFSRGHDFPLVYKKVD